MITGIPAPWRPGCLSCNWISRRCSHVPMEINFSFTWASSVGLCSLQPNHPQTKNTLSRFLNTYQVLGQYKTHHMIRFYGHRMWSQPCWGLPQRWTGPPRLLPGSRCWTQLRQGNTCLEPEPGRGPSSCPNLQRLVTFTGGPFFSFPDPSRTQAGAWLTFPRYHPWL